MSIWEIIPTSDNLMSSYTLVTFVIYTGVLLLVGKVATKRLDDQDTDIEKLTKAINGLKTEVAVMNEALKNVAAGETETRTAIAEINRTLFDKLT